MKLIENVKTLKKMFSSLLRILDRKQKMKCVLLIIGMLISSLFETLGVSAVIPFVLILFSPDDMMNNDIVREISQILKIESYHHLIFFVAISIIVVYVVKNMVVLLYQFTQGRFRNRVEKDLGLKMFKYYMNLPYASSLKLNTAEMLRNTGENIVCVVNVIDAFGNLFTELLTCTMIGMFLILMDPLIALGLVGIALFIAFVMVIGFKNRASRIGKRANELFASTRQAVIESYGGYKDIKVNNRAPFFIKKYSSLLSESCELNTQNLFMQKLPGRVIETVFIGCLLLLSSLRIALGGDTASFVSVLSAMALASIRILPAITNITNYMNILVYNRVGLEKTYENVVHLDELCDRRDEEILVREKTGKRNIEIIKKIEFENIEFTYDGTTRKILDGISLIINRGDSIGIIGESGAGKSTFLDIVLGLLEPNRGSILLNGKELSDCRTEWASIVGYVSQSVFLLDDTIARNVAFAVEDSLIDLERVKEVLIEAQLYELIESLPQGIETKVGERGIRFSGGQRQRLALARALYHKPEILVLDEATSALDYETERAVMEAIEQLHGKLTMIIVAHRLSTLKKCDKVYNISGGKMHEVEEINKG